MTTQDGEFWRRKGYELVMRLGTLQERMETQARLQEILGIRRQTEIWMAHRMRQAA